MKGLASASLMLLLAALVIGGGPAPLGRLALSLGLPSLAEPLFHADPAWQGVALYRAGDMTGATRAFTEARDYYNLGNAEALRGNYAAALEAYDVAIIQYVPNALDNFDAVAAYYAGLQIAPEALALLVKRISGPTVEAETGEGSGRGAGTGDDVTNTNTMMGLAQFDSHGRLGVRRVFDDAFMIADHRWLEQLSDVPGAYLGMRIAYERKRRNALGLSPPEPEDPR